MLRLFSQLGSRLVRTHQLPRWYSTESQTNFDDFDREKKIKILELEIDVLQQEGRKVPEVASVKADQWEHILQLATKSARYKYYQFLWLVERKRENEKFRKEKKKVEIAERLQIIRDDMSTNEHIVYGLSHNSFLLRIYDSKIDHWNNNKLVSSMLHEQKLVIDCSYDEHMNHQEASNCAKQLMYCFAENRMHDEPFDLHYCNFNSYSTVGKTLAKFIPKMHDDEFPLNTHKQSFTEVFDKDRLVYLTPHCRNELQYSHDDVYIIGAMVDKKNNEPLSLAKAKKLGLRMAQLPLDRYLSWGAGSGKSLTLNQMVNIMLNMKKTGDWNSALQFVPRRKLMSSNDQEEFNRRQDQQERRYQRMTSNDRTNDRQFDNRERKHYNKFKFDLNTWGDKVKQGSSGKR